MGWWRPDVTLKQIFQLIKSVNIAELDSAFLRVNELWFDGQKQARKCWGLVSSDVSGQGVIGVDRSLRKSISANHRCT